MKNYAMSITGQCMTCSICDALTCMFTGDSEMIHVFCFCSHNSVFFNDPSY